MPSDRGVRPGDGERSAHDPRLERWLLVLTLVATLAPVAVVVITRSWRDYTPLQDFAVFHLRLRDVLSTDTPLVGVYSQYGWNHPGPAGYWLVAPFVWLAGGAGWGMLVGSAVVQGVAIGATALITYRAAGARAALFWVSVAALAYGATGPWVVLEAWNPHIALPIFVLFLATAWCAAISPGAHLPTSFVVGSVLIQLHIGYAPLVLPVWLWLAWRCTRAIGWRTVARDEWRPLTVAAVVLWSAPLLHELVHPRGNLRALISYFVLDRRDDPTAGPMVAIEQLADALRLPPPWLLGSHSVDTLTGSSVGSAATWALLAAAAVVVGLVARRSAGTGARRLLDLSWITLAAGLVALAGVRGQVRLYQFYWIDVVAVLLLAATAIATWSAMRPRLAPSALRRTATAGLCLVALVVTAVGTDRSVDVAAHGEDVHRFEPVVRELLSAAESAAPPGPVIVRWVGSPLGGVQAGIVNGLDRAGVDVRVDRGAGFQWGYHREARVADADEVWFVSEIGYAGSYLLTLPGARLVADTSPLDVADEDELVRLQRSIAESLVDADRSDLLGALDSPLAAFALEDVPTVSAVDRDRLGELNELVVGRGTCRCSLVAFPSELAPLPGDDPVVGPVIPAG